MATTIRRRDAETVTGSCFKSRNALEPRWLLRAGVFLCWSGVASYCSCECDEGAHAFVL